MPKQKWWKKRILERTLAIRLADLKLIEHSAMSEGDGRRRNTKLFSVICWIDAQKQAVQEVQARASEVW
ncbi:MAG TPA: hypothetical protein PLU50_00345 [Pseudobdellovibrionaceae bacterium]|nr:hypothetical protein [Pseudobdellovibrionaceae bacterium]